MTTIKPGDRVIIVAGLSKGTYGVVRDVATFRWSAAVPHLSVDLPEGVRIIRADFLARAA